MGGKSSRDKGARGELEWAEFLRSTFGVEARRGCQFAGGPDSPDVVGGISDTHVEVKRVEKLSIYSAIDQAIRDAGEFDVPYVAHRRNRKGWLVTLRAEDLENFAHNVMFSFIPEEDEYVRAGSEDAPEGGSALPTEDAEAAPKPKDANRKTRKHVL